MTREVLEKMPKNVKDAIEYLRAQYKNETKTNLKSIVRAELYGYVKGLRDAGLISEQERKILYVYGTV